LYQARVLNSPSGQAFGEFALPFADLEIENLLLRMGRSAGSGTRRVDSSEMAAVRAFGDRLFAAVFNSQVRDVFRSSLALASQQGSGLRIRLRLNAVPELVTLPWEILYDSSQDRFLGLSNETPVVRFVDLPDPPRPLRVSSPLRVLVVMASPADYPPLDVDQEWQRLGEAVGDLQARKMVVLERMVGASLADLQRQLRRNDYHILHFIGHGVFDDRSEGGLLIFSNERGQGQPVSAQHLGTVLRDHRPLRLVVLNACEGARTSRIDPFAGAAQSLIRQGIPAVIAMQFEISDRAAAGFAHEFYAAVADSYPVDAALAEARKAIFAQTNSTEWGTPVLYMRAADGRIFGSRRARRARSPLRHPVRRKK
jgi:CHAT domain-containing protein